jgi:hypothetical protein
MAIGKRRKNASRCDLLSYLYRATCIGAREPEPVRSGRTGTDRNHPGPGKRKQRANGPCPEGTETKTIGIPGRTDG